MGLKVFGVLLIVGGLVSAPSTLVVLFATGKAFVDGSGREYSVLTMVLWAALVIALAFTVVAAVVLGVRLLRGRRRRARLIAEAMAIALVVAFACDLMLYGVNESLWFIGVMALILVAAHVFVDPSLSDERELPTYSGIVPGPA